MSEATRYFLRPDETLRDAMSCIDKNAKGVAIVVDASGCPQGTITDGDIRRAVLAGLSLELPVDQLLARKATSPYSKPVTASARASRVQLIELMRKFSVHQIPLLDDQGRVVDLVTIDEMLSSEPAPLRAVIMAGGFGTRLKPLTDGVPKAMLPVGDRPLMERTIEQLRHAGVKRVSITTHYCPEKIEAHFGDGRGHGVEIDYLNEDRPLGTAGALGLMPTPTETMLVINGDILTNLNIRAMVDFHHQQHADMTIGVRQYGLKVPYGVIECDGVLVRRIREKPNFNVLVNAGVYLLEPAAHGYIPRDVRFDMTELIDRLIEAKRTVTSFPIIEYWLDIGQRDDYAQAQTDHQEGRLK